MQKKQGGSGAHPATSRAVAREAGGVVCRQSPLPALTREPPYKQMLVGVGCVVAFFISPSFPHPRTHPASRCSQWWWWWCSPSPVVTPPSHLPSPSFHPQGGRDAAAVVVPVLSLTSHPPILPLSFLLSRGCCPRCPTRSARAPAIHPTSSGS
jgi:hypothetical protein